MDDINGALEISVTAPGGTDLAYVRDADGATSVEGEIEGRPVSEGAGGLTMLGWCMDCIGTLAA